MAYPILGVHETTVPGAPGRSITIRIGEAKYERPEEVLLIGFAGEQGSGKTWWRRRVEKELDARQMPFRLMAEMHDEDVIRVQVKGMTLSDIGLDIIVPIVKEISDARRSPLEEQIEDLNVDITNMSTELQEELDARHPLLAEHIAGTLARIGREMVRQIIIEGFGLAHDDQYRAGELENAAASYAFVAGCSAADRMPFEKSPPSPWPWKMEWWKPYNPERDAQRAAALLGAGMMRRDREEEAKVAEAATTGAEG